MRLILVHGIRKVKKAFVSTWLILLLFSIPAFAISIAVEPSTINVAKEGDLFTVRILLTDHPVSNDVWSVDFRLIYKPDYLKLVDLSGNEMLTVQSSVLWKGGFSGTVDQTAGIIEYSGLTAISISCAGQGLTDSFPITLAELTFKAVKTGKTSLSFDASVNPDETFKSPTVAYLISVDPVSCFGVVIPTPKNAEIQIGDFAPPVIAEIKTTKITRSTATITWTTNENTTSQVQYGLTSALGINSPKQDTAIFVSSHSLTLTGLSRETTYYYKIVSVDAAGNESLSVVNSFKTNLVDETPPSITHEQVLYATEGVKQTITAHVVDDDTNNVPSVFLYYKQSDSTQFTSAAMTPLNSVDFSADIPSADVTLKNVDYYIEARDVSLNKAFSPDNAPASPHTISVSSKEDIDLATVTGTVYKDQAKTTIESKVKVRVIGLGVSAETDDNGKYTLSNLPKPKADPFIYTLEASKDGFLTTNNTYDFKMPAVVDFVLQKSGILSGTVYNSRTCLAVALMVVSLKDVAGNPYEVYTDLDGKYKISNFKLDTYTASFKKIGYKSDPSAANTCPGVAACTDAALTFDETTPSKTCSFLAVPKPVSTISVTPNNIFVAPGEKVQFTASLATEDGENASLLLTPTLSWSVSTPLLGDITSTGEFTAANQSITGFVQVQAEGVTGTGTVNVRKELTFRSVFNEIKPFNPRVLENGIEIRYELTQEPFIVLVKIYTMTGRMIRTLQGEKGMDAGTGTAFWDGKDEFGNEVYNGVYMYQIMAQNKNGTVYSKPKALAIMK